MQACQNITTAIVSPYALTVRLALKSPGRGHGHGLHLPNVPGRSGQLLLHGAAYDTLNQIPGN